MRAFLIVLSLAGLMAPAVASAEQTEIIVRVLAKDSKFVGTSREACASCGVHIGSRHDQVGFLH